MNKSDEENDTAELDPDGTKKYQRFFAESPRPVKVQFGTRSHPGKVRQNN